MDLNVVLDTLKERAETIDGLTVTTNPKVPVVPPMLLIDDAEVDFNESMVRGGGMQMVTATTFVSEADSESGVFEAREFLSGYGDRSIRAALETPVDAADVLSSRVTVMEAQRSASDGYITAVFVVRVHLSGPTA